MLRNLSRSTGKLPLWVRVACVFAVALAISVFLPHDTAAASTLVTAPLSAIILIPWQPALTKDELDQLVNPQMVNQPEVVPWQLYDTQGVATGVTTTLTYYQTINGDKTLSNMEGPGQLPDPQYLVVHYVACDILQIPTTTAITATTNNDGLANVGAILKTARASFEVNMSNKRYGPFSLTMCHATGGETGGVMGVGTLAAAVAASYVNNGVPGSGGFPFSGALVIPPKIGFDVKILFGAAPTIVGGPINTRMSLVGALYRRVL